MVSRENSLKVLRRHSPLVLLGAVWMEPIPLVGLLLMPLFLADIDEKKKNSVVASEDPQKGTLVHNFHGGDKLC